MASSRSAGRGRRTPAESLPADVARAAAEECDPTRCPCDDGVCTLSRYVRSTAGAADGPSQGDLTLEATEQAVAERLQGMPIDLAAMAAVSNVYRAANSVRNHLERTVLAPHDLTWTGWVVLWVVWIWGDIESRHVAAEAGISKGTLTGVASTLTNRGLLRRRVHPDDARRVLLSLTPKGQRLMTKVFPQFNAVEADVTSALSEDEVLQLARSLRAVVKRAEES
ncbi:MAG: MarR family winged helix-turn-helix transcriptional regulator [Candidatus Nanopelagicales bacterium]